MAANHFRNLLMNETNKLIDLCQKWDTINDSEDEIPDEVQGEIRSTVGCAQLLMNERFKQFSGLIDNNEFNLGEQPTTEEDLQGFWDLVFIQVEDVNKKFDNLEKQRCNDWQEIIVIPPSFTKPKVLKKKLHSAPSKPEDKTRIMAARKRLAEAKALAAKNCITREEDNEKENVKTFDAPSFFSVSSPVKKQALKSSLDLYSELSKMRIPTPKKTSPCPKSLLCLNKISPAVRRALGPIGTPQAQQSREKLDF